MQLAAKRSLRRLFTIALPSAHCSGNHDSSLNQTVPQRWCGHTLCLWAHWSLFWRWRCVRTTAFTDRPVLIPASLKRLRTVWSEILSPPDIAEAVEDAVINISPSITWSNVPVLGSCCYRICFYFPKKKCFFIYAFLFFKSIYV
jgi:hypothetical protein